MLSDRYRIVRKLGEGGAGRAYLVYDRKLGKEWVMKEWKECATRRAEREFWEELGALRELDSTYFPRIVEALQENGHRYLVMDWLKGRTLEEVIRQEGALPWRQAVSYTVSLCRAVGTLHERRPPRLHLDLKPANIMVTQEGLKLIDFGSSMSGDGSFRGSGTPGYAPPEQSEGAAGGTGAGRRREERRVDERSDIYSLGAVCYAMLTGHRRQSGDNRMPKGVPFCLRHIVRRAMRADPEKRYQSVKELENALQRVLCRKKMSAGLIRLWGCAAIICLTVAGGSLAAGQMQPGNAQGQNGVRQSSAAGHNGGDTEYSGRPVRRRASAIFRYRKGWRKRTLHARGGDLSRSKEGTVFPGTD